jgi:hypothetical protein
VKRVRRDFGCLRNLQRVGMVAVLVLGCRPAETAPERAAAAPPPGTPAPALPSAPWSGPPLALAEVPAVYVTQWRQAENRQQCALVVLLSPPYHDQATPRAASFAGGWGVAYDMPGLRSAFGIAGAGVDADAPDIYSDWPYHLEWSDGSTAGYGPEGGIGTKQLAYLTLAGERCLYNVWSWFGPEHLEQLLGAVRRVQGVEGVPANRPSS